MQLYIQVMWYPVTVIVIQTLYILDSHEFDSHGSYVLRPIQDKQATDDCAFVMNLTVMVRIWCDPFRTNRQLMIACLFRPQV